MSQAEHLSLSNGVPLLSRAQRTPMWNLISTRVTQFSYFNQVLGCPGWQGRKVLDFGGNIGTFLVGAGHRVDHDDYWCLDLNRTVIERGPKHFPRAHFVHYNRYHSQFNPDGIRFQPVPDLGLRFDFIIAFSVFTHADRSEMIELVGQLRKMLKPEGRLAFTFSDPRTYRSSHDRPLTPGSDIKKNLERERSKITSREIDELVARAILSDWCVLIDEELYINPGDELNNQKRAGKPLESYCSYFTADYMKSLFPDARILAPVSPEWQHCCVLTASLD